MAKPVKSLELSNDPVFNKEIYIIVAQKELDRTSTRAML